jgi:tetratricopeptide (TPR) repeat protein
MALVFVSYAHKNRAEADAIVAELKARDFLSFYDTDDRTGIQPGDAWERKIYENVKKAQAMVLVVTPEWRDSKWCFAEFTMARMLAKPIFPVVHAPTGEHFVGKDLQEIDITTDRGKLNPLFTRLDALRDESSGGFTFNLAHRSPFPGLQVFQFEDAGVFFGRGEEIRWLLERLAGKRTYRDRRLVVIEGASGRGKSSLMRAGIGPRLARSPDLWAVLPTITPGTRPDHAIMDALAGAVTAPEITPDLTALERGAERRCWVERLEGEEPDDALDELVRVLRQRRGELEACIVLAVDQAEELFTAAKPKALAAALRLIHAMVRESQPIVVLMTLRRDHGDALLNASVDGTAKALAPALDVVPLTALEAPRIKEIVTRPAQVAGLAVEDGLVEAIRADAGDTRDALPLIALTLRRMYEAPGGGGTLTVHGYEAQGERGLDGERLRSPLEVAVERQAREAVRNADELALEALKLFLVDHLAPLGADGAVTLQSAPIEACGPEGRGLVDRLVAHRLFTSDRGSDAHGAPPTVRIAHAAVTRHWPLMVDWLEWGREFGLVRRRLQSFHEEFMALPPEARERYLAPEVFIEDVQARINAEPDRFDPELARFAAEQAAAHQERRDKELADKQRIVEEQTARAEEQTARAEEQTARAKAEGRARRSTMAGLIVASVLLIVAIGAGFYADQQRKAAQTAFRETLQGIAGMLFVLPQNLGPENMSHVFLQVQRFLDDLVSAFPDDTILQRGRGSILLQIGDVHFAFDQIESSYNTYMDALTIFENLAEHYPEDVRFQNDLILTLDQIGNARLRAGDAEAALAAYEEGLPIARARAERDPDNTQWQRGVSVRLNNIGDVRLRAGDAEAALAAYEERLAIARALAERDPDNTQWQRDVSVSLNNIGNVRLRAGDAEAALAAYEESLAIARALAERDPDNSGWQRGLIVSLMSLAQAGPGRAVAAYGEALTIAEAMAARGTLAPSDAWMVDELRRRLAAASGG